MTGQPIPIVMRILFFMKTNHPDQSNPKYYAQRRWFFSKTSWKKPILLLKCLVRPASSDFWKAPGVYKWPRRHVARLQRRLDESQIISVMRDRAQISRVRCDWT